MVLVSGAASMTRLLYVHVEISIFGDSAARKIELRTVDRCSECQHPLSAAWRIAEK